MSFAYQTLILLAIITISWCIYCIITLCSRDKHGALAQNDDVTVLILQFVQRSRRYRCQSALLSSMMCSIFVLGFFPFINADKIAKQDIQNIREKISAQKFEIDDDKARLAAYALDLTRLVDLQSLFFSSIKARRGFDTNRLGLTPDGISQYCLVTLIDEHDVPRRTSDIIKNFNAGPIHPECTDNMAIIPIEIEGFSTAPVIITFDSQSLASLSNDKAADRLVTGINVKSAIAIKAQIERLKLDLSERESNILAVQKYPDLIESLQKIGITSSAPDQYLLQLNITRFGIVTFVIIALNIIVQLYRYLRRISVFYDSRIHALLINSIKPYDRDRLIDLVAFTSPDTIDFGKESDSSDGIAKSVLAKLIR